MNPNIPFIKSDTANDIACLPITALSGYLLTEEEQQYIANLKSETASIISTLLLNASVKAGSSLYTQPELNKLYARRDSSYKESDKNDFRDFMNTRLVGNEVVEFTEMSSEVS